MRQIDTFEETFTKDIISQTKPNPTAELRLTTEQLGSLYQDLHAVGILNYSSDFRPTTRWTAGSSSPLAGSGPPGPSPPAGSQRTASG
jgi:hypothetical protein